MNSFFWDYIYWRRSENTYFDNYYKSRYKNIFKILFYPFDLKSNMCLLQKIKMLQKSTKKKITIISLIITFICSSLFSMTRRACVYNLSNWIMLFWVNIKYKFLHNSQRLYKASSIEIANGARFIIKIWQKSDFHGVDGSMATP